METTTRSRSAFTPLTRALFIAYAIALLAAFVAFSTDASWTPAAVIAFAGTGVAYALVVVFNVGGAADRLAAHRPRFGSPPPGFDKPIVVRLFHVLFIGVAALFIYLAVTGKATPAG
ncbi:hypothetical protein [Cryptosporangium minutisporangium]|uniref:Uncharacterized protein n=1 Tax=Cryptosporangium minutisporangium TaxID=113569 RepID=A0ABP6T262_9ACTN